MIGVREPRVRTAIIALCHCSYCGKATPDLNDVWYEYAPDENWRICHGCYDALLKAGETGWMRPHYDASGRDMDENPAWYARLRSYRHERRKEADLIRLGVVNNETK